MARKSSLGAVVVAASLFWVALPTSNAADGVSITKQEQKLRIEINGELFTEYIFEGAQHVYYYPVIGPGGARVTRDWPMVADAEGEHDHPHHRSLWYSHGAVNGVDFWSETPRAGKILHDKFVEIKSGKEEGVIRSTCKWVAPDGKTVCTDERTFRVFNRPASERLFDFEITIKAGDKEVVFGDTKEGTMAVRVAESMRVVQAKKKPGSGHIVLSSGLKDHGELDLPAKPAAKDDVAGAPAKVVTDSTWGKHAEWCDYYGPVGDKTVGIAMFDHPSNPRHPTTWHVRDYGLFAANPFGLHDMEKKPKGAGDLTIEAGKSVTFRYRLYIHGGTTEEAKVAERYDQYVKSK